MSYKSMLQHRCNVLGLVELETGVTWEVKSENIRCFLDLNFIRRGKDPMWTPEAGRPADRSGVLFLLGDAPIKSGDRILMTKGPSGMFSIEGAIDEAWQPFAKHHIEVGVLEVATQMQRPKYNQRTPRG